jgi:predicted adenylyl cyclase CyaB
MNRLNFEVKYHCSYPEKFSALFLANHFLFLGTDEQTDTYFQTSQGILKLRESNSPIESGLIYYEKKPYKNIQKSDIIIYSSPDPASLKDILIRSNTVKLVIKKTRRIFQQDNVRFHLDAIENLGNFLEIEVQDTHGLIPQAVLLDQLSFYIRLLGLLKKDKVNQSYSELLTAKPRKNRKTKSSKSLGS